jgi:hypothetical protein
MPGALQVVLSYGETNALQEAKRLVSLLPTAGRAADCPVAPVKVVDARQPPNVCDVCIHWEIPQAVWFPWAKSNILIVNEATWNYAAWKGYMDQFDVVVFSSQEAREKCLPADSLGPLREVIVVPFEAEKKEETLKALGTVLVECRLGAEAAAPLPRHMPPLLKVEDCPPISIITLVYNRPKFIENACLNLLSSEYPHDKIEWIVIDDSEPEHSPSNRVVGFQEKFKGKVVYVPLNKKTSIGAKRNLGVERASHDILLMMDDDDHYPTTSFRRRVAYLLKARRAYECAACTTIAMYDLMTGISAVNCPPYNLSLGERCSEATLTFTRRFWEQRKFEETSMAEGDAFLRGRESAVAEMPPQQIIVALTHKSNTSRRAVPEGNPGCAWGFPRQLIEFLHGLVGIKVEAA